MRKVLIGAAVALGFLLAVAVVLLLQAHLAIRAERPALPSAGQIRQQIGVSTGDKPIRLTWINTASQDTPRSAVLDPSQDPDPTGKYVMSHAAFVLEWADGRLLLVDVGMTRSGAVDFGRTLEWLGSAAAMEPHGSVAEQLGEHRRKVSGVLFTHLHTDHVEGIADLCNGLGGVLPVFMTHAQAERPNYLTSPGLALLAGARCVEKKLLEGGPVFAVAGFPGVAVIDAGGHTPGSQIVVAEVADPVTGGTRRYAFGGDIANNIDGIHQNIPKPYIYSLLVVPEDRERLDELRRYLAALESDSGFTVLLPHDQLAIEAAGIPRWKPRESEPVPVTAGPPGVDRLGEVAPNLDDEKREAEKIAEAERIEREKKAAAERAEAERKAEEERKAAVLFAPLPSPSVSSSAPGPSVPGTVDATPPAR